jgi:hypothetical protein
MFREGMGCVARHHGDNRRGLASRDRDPPRNEGPFCLGTFCAAPEMAAASRGRPGAAGARALALSEDGCTSADGRPNYPQARSWITPRLGAAPCASQSDDNRKGSTSKRQGAPDGDLCLSGLAGIGGDPDRKGERACAPLLRAALCTRGKPDAHASRRQSWCTVPRLHEAKRTPS